MAAPTEGEGKEAPKTKQPLGEVFGHPVKSQTPDAIRYRSKKLCPFNNGVPNCTKTSVTNPLGVCSLADGNDLVITCPVRFRQGWVIADDAAEFFFPKGTSWTTLTEIRLKDADGESAGNIDVVLCSYDDKGAILDFGALEVQAVYISGNVRLPFEHYLKDSKGNAGMDWSKKPLYPRADYLSSSRKRLAPQLIFKGEILKAWGKKTAVALNTGFFQTLPDLDEVDPKSAEIAWFVYDIEKTEPMYTLKKKKVVYTKFNESLQKITRSRPGKIEDFLAGLQEKVNEKLINDSGTPPETEKLSDLF